MNFNKILLAGFFCFISMGSITNVAYAEDGNVGDVVYANGGVGQEEADEMRAKAGSYTMRLYMSEGKHGHAITDVQVSITDKSGHSIDLPSSGPMLFLQMKKGTYKISAKYNDVTITRNATISGRKGANVYLIWKSAASAIDNDSEDAQSKDL